jgi:uncharacterized protein YndB with AHSA1/START domain
MAQNGKAVTIKKTFSRSTSISIEVKADSSIIWTLLTNASDYARWNSTVISIEGNIAPAQKINLTSTLAPKRVFKLKVKDFEPESRLTWGDGMGNRVYTLEKKENDMVLFCMTEKIGGPMFPLFSKMIPPFDKSFEQFAADLKKEAETIMHTR